MGSLGAEIRLAELPLRKMLFLIFIVASVVALTAQPRLRRILVWVGIWSVGSAMGCLFLPGLLGGDAYYRIAELGLSPLILGGGLCFGALGRTILDQVPLLDASSLLGRCLRVLLLLGFIFYGGSILLGGFLAFSQVPLKQRDRFDRSDLNLVFRTAIDKRIVAAPSDDFFQIVSANRFSSRPKPYRIIYRDQRGLPCDYFAKLDNQGWKLRRSDGKDEPMIALPRVNRPY
jgi:hypothetical protein